MAKINPKPKRPKKKGSKEENTNATSKWHPVGRTPSTGGGPLRNGVGKEKTMSGRPLTLLNRKGLPTGDSGYRRRKGKTGAHSNTEVATSAPKRGMKLGNTVFEEKKESCGKRKEGDFSRRLGQRLSETALGSHPTESMSLKTKGRKLGSGRGEDGQDEPGQHNAKAMEVKQYREDGRKRKKS